MGGKQSRHNDISPKQHKNNTLKWNISMNRVKSQYKIVMLFGSINADPKLAGEKRLMNLTSLDEWRSEAYESAKMFKEKVKKWHAKRILKREFNVGDKVLLFRSHFRFLPGKLLSRWEGPFHIEEVYRSGAIKINNFEGTKPHVVNGQRHKHYMAGDPINVDGNKIYTSTHEEHVAAQFQIPA